MNKSMHSSDKRKLNVVLICILIAVIIALVVIVVVLLQNGNGNNSERKNSGGDVTVINEENAGTIVQQFEDDSADTQYHCRMSTDWTFGSDGIKSEDAYVANIEPNHYPIYFEVVVGDDVESYYTSPIIPVGSEITGLELDRRLDPGEYNGKVIYHLVDEEGNEVSSMAFEIIIHVQK